MSGETLVDRPLRSVFIGNIPYEVTEEKLKEIFSEVGPVVSMKLVYDRDTGKPKGYGFCEYKDVETAMSAMRNLNGYEINGRVLRVDNAGAERHRLAEVGGGEGGERERHRVPRQRERQQAQEDGHDMHFSNSREQDVPPAPEKAPEVIGRAVASLPPEQMFELMKQMKMCIQNNPSEARTMLLQNPQLAYALLQAQVVMKIIDPPMALAMLHKDNSVPVGSLMPEGQAGAMMMGASNPMGFGSMAPPTENPWIVAGANAGVPLMPLNPPGPFGSAPTQPASQATDMDFRTLDPRMRNQPAAHQDLDLRDPRSASDRFGIDPRQQQRDRDMRADLRGDRDLRDRDHREISDPRSRILPSDPRQRQRDRDRDREAAATAQMQSQASKVASALPNMPGFGAGATDAEKAALIMQVLQLSDEQIAILPAEQRQSILVLKEQIAKSTQR